MKEIVDSANKVPATITKELQINTQSTGETKHAKSGSVTTPLLDDKTKHMNSNFNAETSTDEIPIIKNTNSIDCPLNTKSAFNKKWEGNKRKNTQRQ